VDLISHPLLFLGNHFEEILTILKPVLIIALLFQVLPLLVLAERRGAAFIQDRQGPQRATFNLQLANFKGIFTGEGGDGLRLRGFGMLFNIADLVKLLFKESFVPPFAHKWWYILAPAIPVLAGLLTPSVLPWFAPITHYAGANDVRSVSGQIFDTDNGLLVLFAIGSLSVYGVVLGSWSSNSKYALLGGMRASAMMISYEVSMGLSALGMILLVGDFSLTRIVDWQAANAWGVFVQPIGFLLFLTSLFAECNRNPFDVAEGESELVAGFHTEYASAKFMLFMTGEYLHILVASALVATLYLGGFDLVPFSYKLPGGPYDTAFIEAHLGVVAGLMLIGGGVFMLFASHLVAGRKRHYAKLAASDRASRIKEYELFSGLFMFLAVIMLFGGAASLMFLTTEAVPGALFATKAVYPLWVGVVTAVIQLHVVLGKTLLFCWLFIWVRWTLPRFRYDQIMALGWKIMLNIALANLLITALIAKLLT
jgi:NADH-quinone oxidoreductase subunit H